MMSAPHPTSTQKEGENERRTAGDDDEKRCGFVRAFSSGF